MKKVYYFEYYVKSKSNNNYIAKIESIYHSTIYNIRNQYLKNENIEVVSEIKERKLK